MLITFLIACNVFTLAPVEQPLVAPSNSEFYDTGEKISSSNNPQIEETIEETTDQESPSNPINIEETEDSDLIIETGHPLYAEDGTLLYPIIPEDFEETGLLPSPENSRTLEDCNIPDDFMLVTYLDLDQDGFGTLLDTRSSSFPGCYGSRFIIPNTGPVRQPNDQSTFFSTTFASDYQISPCDYITPLCYGCNTGNTYTTQLPNRTAISLFPEIYNENSGIQRLYKAIEVINQEGGLPYELTAQAAITSHRKQFRNELIYIAEQRCAASPACYNVNYISWNHGLTYYGFDSRIFLTFGSLTYSYQLPNAFSPFIATFWLGDEAIQYDYSFYDSQQRQSYIVNAPYDTMPDLNQGFFTCSWFGDDADGDGWTLEEGDCNDGARWISPDAIEIPNNNVDNNCDGFEYCYNDNDNDGFYGITSVFEVQGNCPLAPRPSDCNDNNNTIYPDAQESACDGIDSNCNGRDEM